VRARTHYRDAPSQKRVISAFRQRGFLDGKNGRHESLLLAEWPLDCAESYRAGYRFGSRERERAA
jgi:hypothetical protein